MIKVSCMINKNDEVQFLIHLPVLFIEIKGYHLTPPPHRFPL